MLDYRACVTITFTPLFSHTAVSFAFVMTSVT
jgi:hypothetical protein